MTVPFNEWLAIVTYRDFYDVPRLILATDERARLWIFESKFDDELDDYSSDYVIYFAGWEDEAAQSAFARYADTGVPPDGGASNVPVKLVEFDQTRRHKFLLRTP